MKGENLSLYPVISPGNASRLDQIAVLCNEGVKDIALYPDNKYFVIPNGAEGVRLFDLTTGEVGEPFETGSHIHAVNFSADGAFLALGCEDGSVQIWQRHWWRKPCIYLGHTQPVYTVGFSPNGRLIASGSDDGHVIVRDVASGQQLANYEHAGVISSVAFSPDNVSLAVSDWNSGITIRDVLSGKTTYKLKESDSRVQTIGFLPNNRFFVAGSDDGVIRLWDLDKDNGQLSKVVVAHSKPVTTLAFAPDGFTLASGSEDHCVAIWDILYGEKLSGLIGHTASVWGVDFSQNGRLLASVADDCTIRVWAVK